MSKCRGTKQAALEKILNLQQQLAVKENLELEIEKLQGKLEVAKHHGLESKEKIDVRSQELKDKMIKLKHWSC